MADWPDQTPQNAAGLAGLVKKPMTPTDDAKLLPREILARAVEGGWCTPKQVKEIAAVLRTAPSGEPSEAQVEAACAAFGQPNTPEEIATWGETGAAVRRAIRALIGKE